MGAVLIVLIMSLSVALSMSMSFPVIPTLAMRLMAIIVGISLSGAFLSFC